MSVIVLKPFNGLNPISDALLSGPAEAQIANNVRLLSGTLSPLRGVSALKSTVTSQPATIFRYGSSSNEANYWLEFASDTDVMRSPIANDQYDRLYWTSPNARPRYAPNSMILSGGGGYPGASLELGIPKPASIISIDTFATVTTYTKVTREYVLTLYNPTASKESVAGTLFTVQAVDGQTVAFTNLTTDNLGDAGVTKKRLYRKLSTTFRLIAEIDLSATTYDDTTTDAALASAATLNSTLSAAPTASTKAPLASSPDATATAAAISRDYVYSLKGISTTSGSGENITTNYYNESGPSPVRTVSCDTTQSVTIGGMSASYGATHFRIYRKDAGSSQFKFIGEVPSSAASFVDVVASTTLGSPIDFDGPTSLAPASAPTGSANTSAATSVVRRIYMATYLDSSNNESSKGPSSATVTVVDGGTAVTITHSDVIPAGVSKKRIYRQTVTFTNGVINSSDANWKLVTEVAASATSVVDSAAESTLTVTYATALRNLPSAPTDTPTSNATIPADGMPESRTYCYTYVTAYGEEGPPSDASDVVDLDPEESVGITVPGSTPSGSYNITLKRIYRSSTVGANAKFQFLTDIPVATTTYADATLQDGLLEVLQTEKWKAPPVGLKGLRLMANGAAVGFVGQTVYLSEPNLPHAWPHQYAMDDEIVGIATYGQTVAVITKSFPYLLTGVDPAAMSRIKLLRQQAGVGKRGIIETGDGALYTTPDGLATIGNDVSVITEKMMTRDQWQAYNPSSMECYLHNGKVHVLYNNGTRGILIFDFTGQGAAISTCDVNATTAMTAGHYDADTDTLYFAQGGSIVRFDSGSTLSMTWKSKKFRLPFPSNFAVAQVRAKAYPATFKVFTDGSLRFTKSVADANPFRLPAGFKALDWEFQFEGTSEVTDATIANSVAEMRAV